MWNVVPAPLCFFLTILASSPWIDGVEDCSFATSYQKGECLYTIHVTNDQNCACPSEDRFLRDNDVQNDDKRSKDDAFSFLKDEHDQRLHDLEDTVKALLGSHPSVAPVDKAPFRLNRGRGRKQPGSSSSSPLLPVDDRLLKRLHEELGKLRAALRMKTRQLFDAQLKDNEREKMFQRSQINSLSLNENLTHAENKITILEQERVMLRSQLNDRNNKLDSSSERLAECETQSEEQEKQLDSVIRSERFLTDSLRTCQLFLNNATGKVKALETSQLQTKARHRRTKTVLRIRERELINCYAAKTQTFCGFERSNICGFSQARDRSDFFDWEWGKGKTPSYGTGPSVDHTCGSPDGHFMYIEASAKSRGRNAILYSPLYRGMKSQCVEFYYHMYGRHTGTLNVYAKARGQVDLTSVWRAWGNQGDTWSVARLAIPKPLARAGYQIAFEVITEHGYLGDISIDDVSVTDGDCENGEVESVRVMIDPGTFVEEVLYRKPSRHSRRRSSSKNRNPRRSTGK